MELSNFNGIGVIVEFPSGVRYTNQIGGYACNHPQVEGVFLSLTHPLISQCKELQEFFVGPRWKGSCYEGIDKETANFIDAILAKSTYTQALKVNRAKLADSHEAWVHVIVSPRGQQAELWSGFSNALGIITWENSD